MLEIKDEHDCEDFGARITEIEGAIERYGKKKF
jgi:hypothetical protein